MAKYDYRIRVEASGEELQLNLKMPDMLRWEMNHKGQPWLTGDIPSFSKLIETAYYAGRRSGEISVKNFDLWMKSVTDIEILPDEDDDLDGPADEAKTDEGDDEGTFQ